jgi:hypothetical protein
MLILAGWLVYGTAESQAMIDRYDPGLHNQFLGGYALNDSMYRVFSQSDGGDARGFSSFIVTDYQHGIPTFREYNVGDFDYPPLYGTYELFVISLPSGDAFLAGNFFDCDIGGFAMMHMTADYQVEWHLYSFEIGSGAYKITQVGIVAPDVMVVGTDEDEQIYISFDGDIVTYPTAPPGYLHPLYADQYIFGFRNGQWVKLDDQFQAVDSIAVDTIAFVAPVGTGFLMQTNDSMLLVDSTMQIIAERDQLPDIHTAVQLGNRVGVGNPYLFMVLDSALNSLQTYLPMPFERFNFAMATADTAFLLSTYNGIRHSDFISRKYVPGQDLTSPSPDLRMQNLDMPDTVLVSNWNNPQWYFGTSTFEIENVSIDTVQHFRLECNWIPFLGFCSNYERVWLYENVNLLPGETRTFTLDSFEAALEIGHHSPFCFWIESANGFPDPNPNDNYACDAAQIVTASQDISSEVPFTYFPNPCRDIVHIELPDHPVGQVRCSLFSADGNLHYKRQLSGKTNAIQVNDMPPGMYFIRLQDDEGHTEIRKLIIQE